MDEKSKLQIFDELFRTLLEVKRRNIRIIRFPEVEAIIELTKMSKEELVEKLIDVGMGGIYTSEKWEKLILEKVKLQSQIKKLKASAKKTPVKKSKKK